MYFFWSTTLYVFNWVVSPVTPYWANTWWTSIHWQYLGYRDMSSYIITLRIFLDRLTTLRIEQKTKNLTNVDKKKLTNKKISLPKFSIFFPKFCWRFLLKFHLKLIFYIFFFVLILIDNYCESSHIIYNFTKIWFHFSETFSRIFSWKVAFRAVHF